MKILEIKNTGTEIKNVIRGFISRLDISKRRINKPMNLKIGEQKLSKLKHEEKK